MLSIPWSVGYVSKDSLKTWANKLYKMWCFTYIDVLNLKSKKLTMHKGLQMIKLAHVQFKQSTLWIVLKVEKHFTIMQISWKPLQDTSDSRIGAFFRRRIRVGETFEAMKTSLSTFEKALKFCRKNKLRLKKINPSC